MSLPTREEVKRVYNIDWMSRKSIAVFAKIAKAYLSGELVRKRKPKKPKQTKFTTCSKYNETN